MQIVRDVTLGRMKYLQKQYEKAGKTEGAEALEKAIDIVKEMPATLPEIAIVDMTRKEVKTCKTTAKS